MSSVFAPIPPIPPYDTKEWFKILINLGKVLKDLFTPPKKKETPEDVAERNRAFQSFCEKVNMEAKQVENYIFQQLDAYIQYFDSLSSSGKYPFLEKYQINLRRACRQVEFLKAQIPGIIGNEVSCRLSDTDTECMRVRRMLPGAEKEVQMQAFLQNIICNALEKCASATESIIGQLQDDFIEELQNCLFTAKQQHERIELEFEKIRNSEDALAEQACIRAEAEYKIRCCDLVSSLMK